MNIQISNSHEKLENCMRYIYIFAWSKVVCPLESGSAFHPLFSYTGPASLVINSPGSGRI